MKTAIVTGAGGNLGQAVVKKFIEEGYQVAGTVTAKEKGQINLFTGGPATVGFEAVEVDLTDEDASEKFVDSFIEKNGGIDVAVLTVGGFAMGKIAGTKTSDISKQYKLNFETAYNIARPVFAQMMKQKTGRIFLTGSKPGLSSLNSKGMVAYSLAKSLIFRLAELMNEEAKGTGVITTVVVPGTIDTPQNRQSMPGAAFDNWVKPEVIANAVYYYTTEEANALREPILKLYNNS